MDCNSYYSFISGIKRIVLIFITLLLIGLSACERNKTLPIRPPYDIENLSSMTFYANSFLPDSTDSSDLTPADRVKIIRPGQAEIYLGENTEQYLTYQMVGLASAKYVVNDDIIYVEIIQFADNTNAYGFYARLRPDGIAVKKLGVESYSMGNTLSFTKGEFVITLSVENDNESSQTTVDKISRIIEKKIEALSSLPSLFILFPYAGKIYPSSHFNPYQFLDIAGLDQVYTSSYLTGGDTVILFITMDESGEKYLHIKEYAESLGKTVTNPKGFGFEQDNTIAFNYPDKGVIVVGLIRKKLAGAVGYNPSKNKKLFTDWIKGLQ